MMLQTYDSDVEYVFEMPSMGSKEVTLNYVGIRKDILKLNYGPPVIFFRCEWMKQLTIKAILLM